ncbi:hypothetical protein N431DRAFT_218533 [Stipitochalara longipes BDJ]|nr:hypothetical protein N431DRAFT_218533 [Stipitochalara longipes BDJ]
MAQRKIVWSQQPMTAALPRAGQRPPIEPALLETSKHSRRGRRKPMAVGLHWACTPVTQVVLKTRSVARKGNIPRSSSLVCIGRARPSPSSTPPDLPISGLLGRSNLGGLTCNMICSLYEVTIATLWSLFVSTCPMRLEAVYGGRSLISLPHAAPMSKICQATCHHVNRASKSDPGVRRMPREQMTLNFCRQVSSVVPLHTDSEAT